MVFGGVPSRLRMNDMGTLPSRCSGAITTMPWLAKEPVMWLYAFRDPPSPWENIMTGHFSTLLGGRASFASRRAGMVV